MLREDKTARVELIKGRPGYQGLRGWKARDPEPDSYEFSVGKYTRSGNLAAVYHFTRLTAEQHQASAELQLTQPVLVMHGDGDQWWWYWNRFWKDDENLTAADVQMLLIDKERKKQARIDRARASVLGVDDPSSADAARDKILRQEERERKQRATEERAAQVERLNAELDPTISALENLLLEGLEHDATLEFEIDDDEPDTIASFFSHVLDTSPYPAGFPNTHRVAFVPESRQLVVEYELPTVSVVPSVKAYRHVRSRNAIEESARPVAQVRALYGQVVAQTALRVLHDLFRADRAGLLETIVLNCYVDTTDPATGQPARPFLVTVRTSKETFEGLNLRQVDPFACLRGLRAGVSRSPHELAPVRPLVEFDMVDPRFIEESDVLSGLDHRPNLMELTPKEFEALISNLFEKMGLDTRQTQASRDGGVDCVAWDHRPIFGGKVIIQAKRYKNTVGVSAVRDLFGTMQNEGASKGILVTTSGYGKSSFEFAEGKPLELLSGSNLLYLLSEHAGIEARIEAPEDWVDPTPDIEVDEPVASPPSGTGPGEAHRDHPDAPLP